MSESLVVMLTHIVHQNSKHRDILVKDQELQTELGVVANTVSPRIVEVEAGTSLNSGSASLVYTVRAV